MLGFFLILLDQFSKGIAARISAVSHNSGIAFGLAPGLPTAGLIFLIAWLAFDSFRHRQLKVSEVIFLAGGISNVLDRIWRGKVIDWMRISSLWFNLADVYIVLGMTLIIGEIIFIRTLEH